MKNLKKIIRIVIILLAIVSCNMAPKAIDYGNDGCQFCKMTIVDKIHAAELITDKGKVFKFDATECMLNYINHNKDLTIGSLLTNYYEVPTDFIPNHEAIFLISENLPSPMGANLTAFKTREQAEKVKSKKEGIIYDWNTLKAHLNH